MTANGPIDTTPSLTCLVFPHEAGDGFANMARDEALLDLVTREPGAAALRTYCWSEPTLSLGYFQSRRGVEADPRWRSVPVVRRPTGGGAIWHDREVTYSLAIPGTHPLARGSRELYSAVHGAIAGLLVGLGVSARRRGGGVVAAEHPRPFLCFRDRDPGDLVVGPSKIVGSAQRRRAGSILQHGSLLLARSERTPELPGVADLSPVADDPAFWSALLQNRLPEALGFVARPGDWPAAVVFRSRELEDSVYRDPGWTNRR